jgi:hypothetical protein
VISFDHKFRLKSWMKVAKHGLLLTGMLVAITSRGSSWSVPPNLSSVNVGGKTEEVDTAVMCAAFKDGLLKTGLVVGLHASLPRDDNDYELFSTSADADGLFVSINEQRQFILYFGKVSAGYEITMPDPEFIADVWNRTVDKVGQPVVDNLDTTIFITRIDESSDQVALEAMTSSPFLSTVVKIIPLSSVTNLSCDKTGTLGLGANSTSAGLDIGKTGKTSKASMLRSIYVQRSIASLLVALWLVSLWFTRKREDAEQADHA